MSSMLKKTGGLAFKPKAGRRPGAAPRPATGSASTNATPAPVAESQSQAVAPGPSNPPPTATPADKTTSHAPEDLPATPSSQRAVEPQPASQPSPQPGPPLVQAEPRAQPPLRHSAGAPTVLPTPDPTISSTQSTVIPDKRDADASASGATTSSETKTSQATEAPKKTTKAPIKVPKPTPQTEKRPSNAPPKPQTPASRSLTSTTDAPTPTPSTLSEHAAAPSIGSQEPAPASVAADVDQPAEEASNAAQTPAPKKKATRKRKAAATEGEASAEGSVPKKKRQYKRRAPANAQPSDAAGENEGEAEPKAPRAKSAPRRRRRSPTPEDAENMTVDHATTKVGDLTKDLGIGKRFKYAQQIEDRHREARAKNQMRRLERQKQKLGLIPVDGDEASSRTGTPADANEGGAPVINRDTAGGGLGGGSGPGVGYEVIDGQIIINQESLVVDRHAQQDMVALETVEEDDFTHLTTSATYMRRHAGPNFWSDEDTEKFYYYLRMFGTDFETISHMFPLKNRRAVKLKFNREERQRPNRIKQAIFVRGEKKTEIDMEEYKASRKDWKTADKIMEGMQADAAEKQGDIERLKSERRALGLLDDEDETTEPLPDAGKNANGEHGAIDGEMQDAIANEAADGEETTTVMPSIEGDIATGA
ncbi:hypothetical protein F4780DRAFT_611238 [Xylariomycetidae sp. FL0641]|nr:hypothetical protein F4780DRAFT_611238 [Xylariomycetidae sp. FL0641]